MALVFLFAVCIRPTPSDRCDGNSIICYCEKCQYLNSLKPQRSGANGARYPIGILQFVIVDFALIKAAMLPLLPAWNNTSVYRWWGAVFVAHSINIMASHLSSTLNP